MSWGANRKAMARGNVKDQTKAEAEAEAEAVERTKKEEGQSKKIESPQYGKPSLLQNL